MCAWPASGRGAVGQARLLLLEEAERERECGAVEAEEAEEEEEEEAAAAFLLEDPEDAGALESAALRIIRPTRSIAYGSCDQWRRKRQQSRGSDECARSGVHRRRCLFGADVTIAPTPTSAAPHSTARLLGQAEELSVMAAGSSEG